MHRSAAKNVLTGTRLARAVLGILFGFGAVAALPQQAAADEFAAFPDATATTYNLVTEPDQGLTSIYNLISSATKTIDMTMYELSDTTVEMLLAQAASDGVKVRVILDQNLEKSNNQAAYTY
ncbi:MAG: phospholipase D-like domain-containing protein [Rudaea sp.]|nr:phospholipase D-like domain-containing protein [Rudaea sp.]